MGINTFPSTLFGIDENGLESGIEQLDSTGRDWDQDGPIVKKAIKRTPLNFTSGCYSIRVKIDE